MSTFKQPMRKGVAAAPTQSQSEDLATDLGLGKTSSTIMALPFVAFVFLLQDSS